MSDPTFDGELLRTFVAVVDCGGFAKAGLRRHLTQSTVSQQMRRLEEQVGRALFAPAGRKRVLTERGELLLGFARKILALNDTAAAALQAEGAAGVVRLGATQDFADEYLPATLRAFGRANRRVRVEVRVGRSRDLRAMVEDALLDAAIVFDDPGGRPGVRLRAQRVAWLAAKDFARAAGEPLPLALFDPPCVFREIALQALDRAHIPWRIAYSSPSLSGIFAAVRSGFALTARCATTRFAGLSALGARHGLPALGRLAHVLLSSSPPLSPAVAALVAAVRLAVIE